MNERTIYLKAIEIADAFNREAYLCQACGDDAALRAHVELLLNSHKVSSQVLESSTTAGFLVTLDSYSPNDIDNSEDKSNESTGESELKRVLLPSTRPGWLGRVAHYEIESILGRGAFGIVTKAYDEKLHRVVAIKFMNPDLAATSPPRKRFLREARTAVAVRHEISMQRSCK